MKQTILTTKQSDLLERIIVMYGQIVTSEQIYKEVEGIWERQQAKKLVTKLVGNGWLIKASALLKSLNLNSLISFPLVISQSGGIPPWQGIHCFCDNPVIKIY